MRFGWAVGASRPPRNRRHRVGFTVYTAMDPMLFRGLPLAQRRQVARSLKIVDVGAGVLTHEEAEADQARQHANGRDAARSRSSLKPKVTQAKVFW